MTEIIIENMKFKLTNEFLKQLSFDHIPTDISKAGKLITRPNISIIRKDGKLQLPTDFIIRDSVKAGFGVRVSKGAVSFFVQRKMGGSTSYKRTLGTFGKDIASVAEARERATIWLGRMALGQDPLLIIEDQQASSKLEREKRDRLFSKVFDDYRESKRSSVSKKTLKDLNQVESWMKKTPLWSTAFCNINAAIIHNSLEFWFRKNPTYDKHHSQNSLVPVYSNDISSGRKCYAFCAAAYNFESLHLGFDSKRLSPFAQYRSRHPLPKIKPRDNVLPTNRQDGSEWLKKLVELRSSSDFSTNVVADYLFTVTLWGGRKTEVQLLTWSDVDFDNRTVIFRGLTTKNNEDHVFPLSDYMAELLRERKIKNEAPRGLARHSSIHPLPESWVFPSRIRGKHIVDVRKVLGECEEASGLHIGTHDLRRTFATELTGSSNGNLPMVKLAMNHSSARSDVTIRHYIQEKVALLRPSYEAHEDKILRIAGVVINKNTNLVSSSFLTDHQIEEYAKDPRIISAIAKKLMSGST